MIVVEVAEAMCEDEIGMWVFRGWVRRRRKHDGRGEMRLEERREIQKSRARERVSGETNHELERFMRTRGIGGQGSGCRRALIVKMGEERLEKES